MERTDQIDVLELLRARGLRMTPQRRAIVGAVMHAQGHISPTVITRKIQSEMPGVNASTVYRTLTLLEEVGILQHSHLESGPSITAPRKRNTSIWCAARAAATILSRRRPNRSRS